MKNSFNLLIAQIEESVGIVKLPNVTSEQEWKQEAKTLKERRKKMHFIE